MERGARRGGLCPIRGWRGEGRPLIWRGWQPTGGSEWRAAGRRTALTWRKAEAALVDGVMEEPSDTATAVVTRCHPTPLLSAAQGVMRAKLTRPPLPNSTVVEY
ncbi:hypothetical protein [Oryza sativa Japonica Group]|uniref:Uncharacterized protein n=1 Tax=Oryza sativa subsp. japonica TaxID=39947 RepID=Q5N787_ORYSJ|nr:hypothetical protein [Oryza sativa Japonica Group]BAD82676.1 hypothetical protein [Oryza sativa Japonica Group]